MQSKNPSKNELIHQLQLLRQKLNRRPQKRDSNYLNRQAIQPFGSWNRLMATAGFSVRTYQKITDFRITPSFAYFLGLVVTDGHIVIDPIRKTYKVAIYTSYPEEKEMLLSLIGKVFQYNASVSRRKYGFNKHPNYEVRISSKYLANRLTKDFQIPAGVKSNKVVVPKQLFNASITLKTQFLKGVIDGDGSITSQGIKISSGSVAFLEKMKVFLGQMDIATSKISKDRNAYDLKIYRKNAIEKIKNWYGQGWAYPRKKAALSKI